MSYSFLILANVIIIAGIAVVLSFMSFLTCMNNECTYYEMYIKMNMTLLFMI